MEKRTPVKIASLALLAAVLALPFSPLVPYLKIRETYDYRETSTKLSQNARPLYSATASNIDLAAKPSGFEIEGTLPDSDSTASYVLALPESARSLDVPSVRVVFKTKTNSEVRIIDDENADTGPESPGLFTIPAVFAPNSGDVEYRIVSSFILPEGSEVRKVDLSSKKTSLALELQSIPRANAAAGGITMVSRADWGADETIRYEDSGHWKAYFEKQKANEGKPESDATRALREKNASIEKHIQSAFADQYASVETIRTENGHPLVWPIEKTKRVEKIVLHHTAENNLKDLTDAELLRATYHYHALTRGWGDIGYNFIVGQRGTLYEGRAGGDYAVGAHASWNNRSTVGISLIGNFDAENLNEDQQRGIRSTISMLAKKYGIDVSKSSFSHRECKFGKDCLVEDYDSSNVVGHRDVGFTSCPGDNYYAFLPTLRKEAALYSAGLKHVENPKIIIAASSAPVAENPSLPLGPSFRVKLSYPENRTVTIEGKTNAPKFGVGTLSGTLKANIPLTLEAGTDGNLTLVLGEKKVGSRTVKKTLKLGKTAFFESDVLRVKSWDRKPTWDKSGAMNDNLFRGKIEVRAENGKILLINELPLERYLKGLAEISNGDHPEKIKTILVAARSYAYFYAQSENRKFPGKPYDGSDDPEVFQKYLGYGYETRSGNVAKLVDETNGMAIAHSGSIIKPWYFSESDGRTRSYKEYCQARVDNGTLAKTTVCTDIPYLMGGVDPGGVGRTLKGHGVGISGIGATYFATNLEWKYPQIIGYYLDGTEIKKAY